MALFSWKKNPLSLANNFVKDFKSFENYMKHCVNGLKQINWFKLHQLDNQVSDFEYMEKFLQIEGLSSLEFITIFKYFNNNVLSKLDKNLLQTIKTNEYYYDKVSQFVDNLTNFNKKVLDGNDKKALIDLSNKKNYYRQLCHTVLTNGFKIDENKCYSNNEIVDLVLNNKILIVDSFVVPCNLSELDIVEKQKNGELNFKERDFNGSFLGVTNCGDINGYIEATSKQEKSEWIVKNIFRLHWLRNNALTFDSSKNDDFFGLHLDKEFNMLYKHINVISDAVQKNYKKRNKNMPQVYLDLINKIKGNAMEQKQKFESKNQIIIDEF